MIVFFAEIFSVLMGFIYSFFKLKKTENKIAFISRQSETPSLDFKYLIDEINNNYPQYKVVVLCKMIPNGFIGKIKYAGEMLRQMNALATSKVAVLDGYCILASVLHHKKELKIIQIWHALGSFKKFGKSILDKSGGKSSETAKAFKMHNNYDLIAASGEKCVANFSEAFGQPESKFIPIGLPRMDYLTDENKAHELKTAIFIKYPALDNGKKNILYVPTFRDNKEDTKALRNAENELIKSVDYSKYNLIVKRHVVDTNKEKIYISAADNGIEGEFFSGMDFMAAADCVVTDYSSVIYEALLKNLPIYIYCFDCDKYIDERGFYIDFMNDIPAMYSKTAKGICDFISSEARADKEKESAFKKAYVNKRFNSITAVYGKIIDELARGGYDGRYNYKVNESAYE
ncbi:MAG: CDP-glycerol glycerophosphotransferase family protein [Clostridiales bacterium]|nr:CDP-glycerol glycerophosphotransferase family protein [Clostridiales bacterium]